MPDLKNSILIVEDEESVELLLPWFSLCWASRPVSFGRIGRQLIEMRQESPDILLSDLNMPGMSGFELLSLWFAGALPPSG